jgi:hypothetical protein
MQPRAPRAAPPPPFALSSCRVRPPLSGTLPRTLPSLRTLVKIRPQPCRGHGEDEARAQDCHAQLVRGTSEHGNRGTSEHESGPPTRARALRWQLWQLPAELPSTRERLRSNRELVSKSERGSASGSAKPNPTDVARFTRVTASLRNYADRALIRELRRRGGLGAGDRLPLSDAAGAFDLAPEVEGLVVHRSVASQTSAGRHRFPAWKFAAVRQPLFCGVSWPGAPGHPCITPRAGPMIPTLPFSDQISALTLGGLPDARSIASSTSRASSSSVWSRTLP